MIVWNEMDAFVCPIESEDESSLLTLKDFCDIYFMGISTR